MPDEDKGIVAHAVNLMGQIDVKIIKTRVFNDVAMMAVEMLERWGVVAAKAEGEDSSGRAKLRLMSPQELVNRACTTAALAFEAFEKRGWILHLPIPEEENRESSAPSSFQRPITPDPS